MVVVDTGQASAAAGGLRRMRDGRRWISRIEHLTSAAGSWCPGSRAVVIDAGQAGAAAGGPRHVRDGRQEEI